MEVERTALPGIGLRHTFITERGRRVAVVSHRTGRRDLVIYSAEDPDTAAVTVTMSPAEADGLAELLATARVVERLAELERQVDGLLSEQIPIADGSPYSGRTLGDTRARTRTGASIVAVVRDPGDVVVVIGSADATAAVAALLASG